ncbi:MAG: 4-alpha-glucanotransferase [Elusimicrobiaceae bacterium]|nr:4-alpha-glucanotransferase [Elusimicrobiaceae bacterium]
MTIQQQLLSSRVSGILLPLSAMKTDSDWGVGDFGSLLEWTRFFAEQGVKIIQILPLQETAPGITCPYSALSAFATDPVYVHIDAVEDIRQSESARQYIDGLAAQIAVWRQAAKAPFGAVKQAKLKALWLGYQHFLAHEQSVRSARYLAFEAYQSAQAGWLRSYALFRALKEFYQWQTWTQWPEELRRFDKTAVDMFEAHNREYVRFFAYIQWILDGQLRVAKAFAQEKGIYIFGDIPFGTNLDSAEVWSERENYRLGWEIGAPADQFSEGGQKWGLPAYDWPYQHQHHLDLWRRKIRRVTELYDIFRLDHLVGFFRTYVFAPGDTKGEFDLQGDQNQIDRGYAFLRMVLDEAHGKLAVGEDLGVIPNYVRRMLVDLQIPGYKVLRWEREDNGYYREPRHYPPVSLATTSTHDTETVREWWETMDQHERANIWEMISAQKTDGNVPWNEETQRAILRRVLGSSSAIAMFSWQDIIGTTDRVNTPGTVGEENWTYRSAYTPQEAAQVYAKEWAMFRQLLAETNRQ